MNHYILFRGRGNTSESIQTAEKYAAAGLIDPLSNLVEKRHYIFHGTQDTFIHFGNFLTFTLNVTVLSFSNYHHL